MPIQLNHTSVGAYYLMATDAGIETNVARCVCEYDGAFIFAHFDHAGNECWSVTIHNPDGHARCGDEYVERAASPEEVERIKADHKPNIPGRAPHQLGHPTPTLISERGIG